MNIISTADLRKKEIINIHDGTRLGYASDFEFDKCSGQIIALQIEKCGGFFGMGNSDRISIPWCKIECIGEDTILVDFCINITNNKDKKKKLFDFGC